jgi:outer membrane lipoprotein-sorting protein
MSMHMSAQTPMTVLDAVAADYNKRGDVEIVFTLNSLSKGAIKLSGQKFNITVDGMIMWFNGTTLWTYVEENQEVNVTNPTDAEIAKINPYAFVSMYKSGYRAEFDKTETGLHHVVLKSTDAKKSFKQINLRISKTDNKLMSVVLTTRKDTLLVIDIDSYKYMKFDDSKFVFNAKDYPGVDVIDLR